MISREEVLEEFVEAGRLGQRYKSVSLSLSAELVSDLRVIGKGRMPWGDDDRNFAAWCDRQEPVVRRFFEKAIAERALDDERGSGVLPKPRKGKRRSEMTPEELARARARDRGKWARMPYEVRTAIQRRYDAKCMAEIRALRAGRLEFVIEPAGETECVCPHCGAVNRVREGCPSPHLGWCCAEMRRQQREARRAA